MFCYLLNVAGGQDSYLREQIRKKKQLYSRKFCFCIKWFQIVPLSIATEEKTHSF